MVAARLSEALAKYIAIFAASGDVNDACAAGRIAFSLESWPDAVEQLGHCERLGEGSGVPVEVVKQARADLAVAQRRVARLEVRVDKPGAAITIDGKPVGVSPLGRPLILPPGPHRIVARRGNESMDVTYDISAGRLAIADLGLQPDPEPEPAPEAPVGVPAPAPVPMRAEPPRTWPGPVMLASAGVGLLGLGVSGIAYGVRLNALADIHALEPTIARRHCKVFTSPCQEYVDALDTYTTASTVMYAAVMTTGVLGGGMLGAGLGGMLGAHLRVKVAPTVGGVVVRGTF